MKDHDTTVQKAATAEVASTEPTRSGQTYIPNVDIVETKDELTLYADMPGVGSENIDIQFEKGELSIHGRVLLRQPKEQRYILREYGIGDFYRVFKISEVIDTTKITAEYSAGVLTLHLPKVEAARPRRISVSGK